MDTLEVYSNIESKTVDLKKGKKTLTISFAGNLDLYFSLYNYDNNPRFIIDKTNYPVYLLFAKLYQNIISGNIYPLDDAPNYENAHLKNKEKALATGLIKNDVITWFSDEYPLEIAPKFIFTKESDCYVLEFFLPEMSLINKMSIEYFYLQGMHFKNFISIRLRNSGSRYEPFNACFMEMYHNLLKLGYEEYHQISIEEYQLLSDHNLTRVLHKK